MDTSEITTEYTNIKVPKELAKKVKPIAKKLGYRSVTEFSLDAIRRRVEQLEEKR